MKKLTNSKKIYIGTILIVGIMIMLDGCKDSSNESNPPLGENCPNELVHFWKFEESSSPFIDTEGSNTLMGDSIQKTNGRIGEGISFKNQEMINTLFDSTFNWAIDTSFAIEFWMKDSTISTTNEVIIGRDDAANTSGRNVHWWIGVQNNGHASFNLRDNNRNGSGISGNTLIADGNWHHIAVVRDHNTDENYLYIDGQLDGQFSFNFTGSFSAVNTPINVGYLNLSPFYYYTGDLDELAVYNSALSANDVQRHYQNGLNGRNYCQ